MPIDPNIILSGNQMAQPQLPDVNAMLQTRTQGMENIYSMERQRAADAKAAQEEQEAAAAEAMLPSVMAAYKNPTDAGLDQAAGLMPAEVRDHFAPFLAKLKAIPDPATRRAILESELAKDAAGRAVLDRMATPYQEATLGIQRGQLAQSQQRLAFEQEQANKPAAGEFATVETDKGIFVINKKTGEIRPATAEGIPGPRAATEGPIDMQQPPQVLQPAAKKGETPDGIKLKPGERYNPQTDRVEAVPGSETFNKQKSTHGKDFQGAINVDRQLQDVEDAVQDVMNTSDWQKMTNTGMLLGRVPNIPGLSSLTGGYDFTRKIKNLDGAIKSLGRTDASTSGKLGNMAVQEWRYVADAIANLDLTNMDAADLKDQLDIIMSKAREMRETLRTGYDQEWGSSQFYTPLPKAKPRTKSSSSGGAGEDVDANNPLLKD